MESAGLRKHRSTPEDREESSMRSPCCSCAVAEYGASLWKTEIGDEGRKRRENASFALKLAC